jgi:hypothetical protein
MLAPLTELRGIARDNQQADVYNLTGIRAASA